MNYFSVTGNLTKDPELKYAASGIALVKVGLANNERVGKKEVTSFFNLVMFGKNAELAAEYLCKGRKILVEGRSEQERSWEDEEGKKHYGGWSHICNRWEFLDKPPTKDEAKAEDKKEAPAAETKEEDVPF